MTLEQVVEADMLAAPWYVRDVVSRHKRLLKIPPGPPGSHRSVTPATYASNGKPPAAWRKAGYRLRACSRQLCGLVLPQRAVTARCAPPHVRVLPAKLV